MAAKKSLLSLVVKIKVVQNVNKISGTSMPGKLGKIGNPGNFNCGLSTGRLQEDK